MLDEEVYLESNMLIVDGKNLGHRWRTLYDNLIKETDGMDPEEVHAILESESENYVFDSNLANTIASLKKSYECNTVVVLDDVSHSRFRKELYPEYKANRKFKRDNEEENAKIIGAAFYNNLKRAVKYAGEVYNYIGIQGVEADDVASYIVNNMADNFDHIWLVSSDEDWDQLIRDNVSKFNFQTRDNWKNVTKTGPRPKETTTSNWFEHHLCNMDTLLDVKVFNGDVSDNIQGVKGIGPKRAITLLEKYGSFEAIASKTPLPGKAQYIQQLNENINMLHTTRVLLDLNNSFDQLNEVERQEVVKACKDL